MRIVFLLFLAFVVIGCKRGTDAPPEPTEAATGNYARCGPVGLAVESVRLGHVRMRGMMGQAGDSKDEVFVVRTRFKLFDADAPVKQPALQRDGSIILAGQSGMKLTDETGREYKQVSGFGFDAVKDRRATEAILTADSPEATDALTFESVAGANGDLTLIVPANYQVKQPNGTFLQPKEPGKFRFRIPKSVWSAPPSATDAGPGNWATVGPVSVSVESVRVGKLKLKGFGASADGESKEDAFVVAVRVKLADPAARVKKSPFMADARIGAWGGTPVVLRRAAGGDACPALTASGFNTVIGRQPGDVELTAAKPETTDLLTFNAAAAEAHDLVLTLYPNWQERKLDGTWADTITEGEFRFRLPKIMWAK